ncbi:MAG: polysaccharide deacetylase family protein [Bdellovibrionales bacterium]|nr:polysaccharide deacetylase family protein [Bdellovibrionales bacterium]
MYKIYFIIYCLVNIFSQKTYALSCLDYKEKFSCPNNKTYPIHLTFDDGPVVGNTRKVLTALKKHKVNATFYVVGERLEHPSPDENIRILRDIQKDGHVIGSHSFRHELHTKLSDDILQSYISRSNTAGIGRVVDGIKQESYLSEPKLFRLPYGDGWHSLSKVKQRKPAVMQEIANNGFTHVGWDLHAYDWDRRKQRNPGILPILMNNICKKKGGIVLLHDLQRNTANNIDEWIRAIKCLGHPIVGMDKFLVNNDIVRLCNGIEPVDQQVENLNENIEEIIKHEHNH